MKPTKEMIYRFLTWPLPSSVHPDGYDGMVGGRTGTNLLRHDEAEQMLTHVLGGVEDEIDQLKVALEDAIEVLRMIDDLRADKPERRSGRMANLVAAEVRRILG